MSEIANKLGQQIRGIRKAKGVSMERLAELASMSPTYVSEIERGRKEASVTTLMKMATALEVRLSDLTAPLESDPAGRVTKFEALGRLERAMREFFTEEEVADLVNRAGKR